MYMYINKSQWTMILLVTVPCTIPNNHIRIQKNHVPM
uniref:Uncharacterized protein n=1 Tax=Arundo donax TaxID=35708 RepID=A0A0A9HG81_ARUDO